MKPLVTKIFAGVAGLVLAAAPLAASAQSRQGHDRNDRGGNRAGEDRGRDVQRGNFERGGERYRVGYSQPVYQQPYVDGYFGLAPGGFQGYYWNGGWYHHRRLNGGVWIYF